MAEQSVFRWEICAVQYWGYLLALYYRRPKTGVGTWHSGRTFTWHTAWVETWQQRGRASGLLAWQLTWYVCSCLEAVGVITSNLN